MEIRSNVQMHPLKRKSRPSGVAPSEPGVKPVEQNLQNFLIFTFNMKLFDVKQRREKEGKMKERKEQKLSYLNTL